VTQPSARRIPLPRVERNDEHPLMTIHETARALGYSDMTIRRRIEARQFPAVKIGSKALVPRAFVERLLADALAGRTVVVEEYAAEWAQAYASSESGVPAHGGGAG
jgi:excisionase family DNA binding protein